MHVSLFLIKSIRYVTQANIYHSGYTCMYVYVYVCIYIFHMFVYTFVSYPISH